MKLQNITEGILDRNKSQRYKDSLRSSAAMPRRWLQNIVNELKRRKIDAEIEGDDTIEYFSNKPIEGTLWKNEFKRLFGKTLNLKFTKSSDREIDEILFRINNEGGIDKAIGWGIHANEISDPQLKAAWAKAEEAIDEIYSILHKHQ